MTGRDIAGEPDGGAEPAPPDNAWTPPSLRAKPCNARTRAGTPCRSPAVRGRPRCRMHGCAPGAGGQPGNRNRLVHGGYSAAAKAERRRIGEMVREAERVLREAKI